MSVPTVAGHLAGHTLDVTALLSVGQHLVSASGDKTVRVWRSQSATALHTLAAHTDMVVDLASCHDDTHVVSCSYDRTAIVWDVAAGSRVHVLAGHDAWVRTAHASPVDPSRLLTGGGDTTLRLWDLRTGEHAATLKGHADWIRAVRFSAHDPHIAVSAGWEDAENRIRVWDTRVAHTVMTLGGHTDAVRVLLPVPNAAHPLVWAGDVAGGILGHDLRLGGGADVSAVRLEGHTAAITSLALHGESSRLLSASADGTVRVWDTAAAVAEEAAAATAAAEAESDEVRPVGSAVASGEAVLSRGRTHPGPEPCLVFSEHGDWVSSVAVAPDKTVISTSGNGKAMLWDLTSGKSLTTCQEAAAVLVSSAAGDDEATHIAYGLANGEVGTVVMPSRDEAAVDGSYYRKSEAASAMAAAKAAAAAVLGDWFMKKGGWKMTGGIQLTGRKNRYCVLAGDCIKYFVGLGDDGLPHDLKGAIELNKHTQVVVKEARLLIHNKNRTWDLEASSVDKAQAWRERILSLLPPSAEGEPADS